MFEMECQQVIYSFVYLSTLRFLSLGKLFGCAWFFFDFLFESTNGRLVTLKVSLSQSNSKNYSTLQRFARRSLTFLTNSRFEYSRPSPNKLRRDLVTAFSAEFYTPQFDEKLNEKSPITELSFAVFSAVFPYVGKAAETCQFFGKCLKRTSDEI